MKIILNHSEGIFSLNGNAVTELLKRKNIKPVFYKDSRTSTADKKMFIKIDNINNIDNMDNIWILDKDYGDKITDADIKIKSCSDVLKDISGNNNQTNLRTDKDLIKLIEEWGSKNVSSEWSNLTITTLDTNDGYYMVSDDFFEGIYTSKTPQTGYEKIT